MHLSLMKRILLLNRSSSHFHASLALDEERIFAHYLCFRNETPLFDLMFGLLCVWCASVLYQNVVQLVTFVQYLFFMYQTSHKTQLNKLYVFPMFQATNFQSNVYVYLTKIMSHEKCSFPKMDHLVLGLVCCPWTLQPNHQSSDHNLPHSTMTQPLA